MKHLLFIVLLFTNVCISQTNHIDLNKLQKKTNNRIEFDLDNCNLQVDMFRINNSVMEFESANIDLPKIIEVTIEPSLSEYLVWINSTEMQTQILNAQKKFKSDNGYKTKLCIGRYT